MDYINRGAILGRRPEDYIAGGASKIKYEVRNASGNWAQFLPPGEHQYSNRGDSMSCVTYSALNSIEMQEKLLTGKQVDYGDRWTAKRSGTTSQGNYLYTVADTIRAEGLVLESDYPHPGSYTFSEFMAPIPEPLSTQLLAKGKLWLQKWDIQYEWINVTADSFRYHLKQAPIQIVIPGHAVASILCEADIASYFDTYEPYVKKVNINGLQDALKIVLTQKNMGQFATQNKDGELRVVLGASTPEQWAALCAVYGLDPVSITEQVTKK